MATEAAVQAVLNSNRALLERARELNIRAGKAVFPAPRSEELTAWLLTRLGGATSIAGIADPEALRLPPLDPAKVEAVLTGNPDTVEVPGVGVCPVTYGEAYYASDPPVACVEIGDLWRALPTTGELRLPSGRVVTLYGGGCSATTFGEFRRQAGAGHDGRLWERFPKPELALPDTGRDDGFPALVELVYGVSAVDGRNLVGYGAIYGSPPHYEGQAPTFQGTWQQERALAEEYHSKARSLFNTWRAKRRVEEEGLAAALREATAKRSSEEAAKRAESDRLLALTRELLRTLPRCPASGRRLGWNPEDVRATESSEGLTMDGDPMDLMSGELLGTRAFRGFEAGIVRVWTINGRVLEGLVYQLWEGSAFRLVLRFRREDDVAAQPAPKPVTPKESTKTAAPAKAPPVESRVSGSQPADPAALLSALSRLGRVEAGRPKK